MSNFASRGGLKAGWTSSRVSQFALGSVRLTSTDRLTGTNERWVTLMSQATRGCHMRSTVCDTTGNGILFIGCLGVANSMKPRFASE